MNQLYEMRKALYAVRGNMGNIQALNNRIEWLEDNLVEKYQLWNSKGQD